MENTNTHKITIHPNKRVASLKMSSDEYKSYVENDEFRKDNGRYKESIIKDIYKKFEDDYDYIILVLNEDEVPPELPSGVNAVIGNDLQGIGKTIFDYSSEYGSQGKLKSVVQMYSFDGITRGPMLHEIMYNWGNYAIPTTTRSHWGYLGGSNKGQLGGFDQSTLVNNGGNSYTVNLFGEYANGGNSVPFSEFELYLMGMMPLSSVSPFDGFTEVSSLEYVDGHSKMRFNAEVKTRYTQSSIESLFGNRIPSYQDSQKDFRALVIAVSPSDLSEEEWTILDNAALEFSKTESDDSIGNNFWEATNGLGSITIGDF